MFLKVFY